MNTRSRRIRGLVAGVAGVTLLLGGSTYALWSASSTQNGGTITAGNLDIQAADSPVLAWDVTPTRTDQTDNMYTGNCFASAVTPRAAHAIDDLANYRVTPQDQIALVFPFVMDLRGDNLVAKLSLDAGGTVFTLPDGLKEWLQDSANAAEAAKKISVDAFISSEPAAASTYLSWGDLVSGTTPGLLGADVGIGVYQAPNEVSGLPEAGGIPVFDPGAPEVCVVLTVEVPDFHGQFMTETGLLSNFTVGLKLEQIRAPGAGNFT